MHNNILNITILRFNTFWFCNYTVYSAPEETRIATKVTQGRRVIINYYIFAIEFQNIISFNHSMFYYIRLLTIIIFSKVFNFI